LGSEERRKIPSPKQRGNEKMRNTDPLKPNTILRKTN